MLILKTLTILIKFIGLTSPMKKFVKRICGWLGFSNPNAKISMTAAMTIIVSGRGSDRASHRGAQRRREHDQDLVLGEGQCHSHGQ